MKNQMSNFDVSAFVREGQGFAGLKLEKAFQPDYSRIWLRFSGRGQKATLSIINGRAIWFEEGNLTTDAPPPHFAMLLRKYLANRTLVGIRQHHFDRIIILDFSGEEWKLELVIELFGKGNVVLVENGRIVQPLTSKSWRHRDVKSGENYVFPPEGTNPLELSDDEILEILEGSGKDLVRTLATTVNLGGSYAEAVCEISGLHKSIPANDLEETELPRLLDAISKLRENSEPDPRPVIIFEGEEMTDVLPFRLSTSHESGKPFPTFNEALKEYFSALPDIRPEDDGNCAEVSRFDRLVEQQEIAVSNLESKIVELQAKGELIYSSYSEVERILNLAKKTLESNDWPVAKARLESLDDIDSFEPNTGKLVCRLSDGTCLSLDVRKDVNENAADKYNGVKKSRDKLEGAKSALAETRDKLAGAKSVEAKIVEARKKEPTKRFWFESYRWFISSSGILVIGGRDARSNDKIVKKHLKDDDLYVHAEIQGAPSVVVKGGKDADEQTLQEACEFALCFSKAWNAKLASGSAYWVKPDQVSKTPNPGEFLPRGAFVIRGKRNYSKKLDVRLAIGEINHEGERKIMCAPFSALESISDNYFVIAPGDESKNSFSKRLSGHFSVPIEEISGILPPGDIRIIKENTG